MKLYALDRINIKKWFTNSANTWNPSRILHSVCLLLIFFNHHLHHHSSFIIIIIEFVMLFKLNGTLCLAALFVFDSCYIAICSDCSYSFFVSLLWQWLSNFEDDVSEKNARPAVKWVDSRFLMKFVITTIGMYKYLPLETLRYYFFIFRLSIVSLTFNVWFCSYKNINTTLLHS